MTERHRPDHAASRSDAPKLKPLETMVEISPGLSRIASSRHEESTSSAAGGSQAGSLPEKHTGSSKPGSVLSVPSTSFHEVGFQWIESKVAKKEHQVASSEDKFLTLIIALSLDKARGAEYPLFLYHETDANTREDNASDRLPASDNTSLQSFGRQSIKLPSPSIVKRFTMQGSNAWDEEKNRPHGPGGPGAVQLQSWLRDLIQDPTGATIAEYSFDIQGDAEFNAAARHLGAEIAKFTSDDKQYSIVFVCHGYASLLAQKTLCLHDHPSIKARAAVLVNFVDPTFDRTAAETIQKWTATRLGHRFEEPQAMGLGDYDKFLEENDIPVRTTHRSPLPPALSDITKLNAFISAGAMFNGPGDRTIRRIRRTVMRDIHNHRMILAAKSGNRTALKLLIETHHNAVDLHGHNALHIAVLRLDLTMVRVLVHSRRFEEYLKHQDVDGNTALHLAIGLLDHHDEDRVRSIVLALFERGASRIAKNNARVTPVDLARGHEWLTEILNRRQVVRGHLVPTLSRKGEPPGTVGLSSCKLSEMTVNVISSSQSEVKITEEAFTVLDLLYSKETPLCFSYNEKDTVCQWFHGPLHNMAWINDIFFQHQIRTWPWTSESRASHFPHGRSMPPQFTVLKDGVVDSGIVSIVMPYISYQRHEVQARQAIHERQTWEASRGTSKQSLVSGDLASQLRLGETVEEIGYLNTVAAYLNYSKDGHDLVLHPRRTLDQYYYYMLRDTSYRDQSQVASRWNDDPSDPSNTVERRWRAETKDHTVLMVDQVWLWKIPPNDKRNHDVIVSNFPGRLQSADGNQDNLRHRILRETKSYPLGSTNGLIARILSTVMNVFAYSDNESLQFIRFFETAIGSAEEDLSLYFRKFRMYAERLYSLHESHREYQKNRSICLKRLLDIREESQLLVEVKDILDEIKMIECVMEDQRKVIAQGLRYYSEDHESSAAFEGLEAQRQETLEKFRNMKDHAKSVEAGILELMDLKQKQGHLWEARFSRENAEESSRQGNTLMIFTIVSIVFLPLSFMSSFLTLSIDSFPRDDTTQTILWPMWLLCAWLFGLSSAVIVPLLLIASKVDSWLLDPWFTVSRIYFPQALLFLLRPISGIFGWVNNWRSESWIRLVNHNTVTMPADIQTFLDESKLFNADGTGDISKETELFLNEIYNTRSLDPLSADEVRRMPRDERNDYEKYQSDRELIIKMLKKEWSGRNTT